MKVLETRVMRGPNYWSTTQTKLIVVKIDLGNNINFPTNTIDGFDEALESLMPNLKNHKSAEDAEESFMQQVRNGTMMVNIIPHVALELQCLAGMNVNFCQTRALREKGIYCVVFSYELKNAGLYAVEAAVKIVNTLASDMRYNITEDINNLREIYYKERLGPSTMAIVREAMQRDIPYRRLDNDSLLLLGQGKNQRMVCATITCTTSSIAVDLASNKQATRRILASSFIPVPDGVVISEPGELENAIKEVGYPIVIKPIDGNHGNGVSTNINDHANALKAFNYARKISENVLVEKFIRGNDYRFLVINFKLVAVARRIPAKVMGDSQSTVEELINETNSHPNRGNDHENVLTKISVDENTHKILVEKKITLQTILPSGEILYLKDTANISSGGTAKDVSDLVHPDNIFLAERVARLMNLDICGIDVITENIRVPITNKRGAVIEVNAAPGFRMHLSPSNGQSRNVALPVIEMLYPKGTPSRIPIVAITGTNGKTTTTRLIAKMAQASGHNVGYTTTDGVYINNSVIYYGDCSGPESAGVILRDPIVDFAVLECARGGILRTGLGFDKCNISIVTNVSEDHLGLKDIHSLEDLAKVKSVVPKSTSPDGYAILNADDDLVYAMKDELKCNIALFSVRSDNMRIREHCDRGGLAAIIENDFVIIQKGSMKSQVIHLNDVPLTFSGESDCMRQNILPAILAGIINNFPMRKVTEVLRTFLPGTQTTPGRMNLVQFKNFQLLIDYAHNEAAFIQVKKYIDSVLATIKIGIINGTGDRRPEDIRKVGRYAAQMFDEIIIKHDRDNRGRTIEQLTDLLMEGIREIDSNKHVKIISDEKEALKYALDSAPNGSLVVIFPDDIEAVIDQVTEALEKEEDLVATEEVLVNNNNSTHG